jgi:uncharacterized protein YifN (PemK superfamily)
VITEFKYNAIVIPISSVKEEEQGWKKTDNQFVEIGQIGGLPNEKPESYAVVSQIRSVSKQRLSDYKYKKQFLKLKLEPEQMDIIDEAISSFLTKPK